MNKLWFYEAVSRRLRCGYATKVLLTASIACALPSMMVCALLAPAGGYVLAVAIAASIAGAAIGFFLLDRLLQPVLLLSRSVREYTTHRSLPLLPLHHADEVGTLMADTSRALMHLDAALDALGDHDEITLLPNRQALLGALRERCRNDAPFALCVMVVRNHERLLTAFGHDAGNALMRELAARLRGRAAVLDVSRVAGHLFAFRLDGAQSDGDAGQVGARLVAELAREHRIEAFGVTPDIGLGIAMHPVDAREPDQLLNNAISASAASDPHDAVSFFSSHSREDVRHRFLLEQDLRHAIERGEFALHYQPIVDLTRCRVIGAEALLRWRHPTRGYVSPAEFIPVAETSGLIDPISRWVLHAACRQLGQWTSSGLAHIRVAINMSANQFRSHDLVHDIGRALEHRGVEPSRLEVELTETMAMHDVARTFRTLAALREMGVRSAIDDFGTGYSSMGHLKSLPVDKLKIDRAFVSNVQGSRTSAAICKSLIELTQGLGMTVLAEGTETREEVDCLAAMGCRIYQGFFFARPMPAHEFELFVVNHKIAETMGRIGACADEPVTRAQEPAVQRTVIQGMS